MYYNIIRRFNILYYNNTLYIIIYYTILYYIVPQRAHLVSIVLLPLSLEDAVQRILDAVALGNRAIH